MSVFDFQQHIFHLNWYFYLSLNDFSDNVLKKYSKVLLRYNIWISNKQGCSIVWFLIDSKLPCQLTHLSTPKHLSDLLITVRWALLVPSTLTHHFRFYCVLGPSSNFRNVFPAFYADNAHRQKREGLSENKHFICDTLFCHGKEKLFLLWDF